jgi:hypothetical protein
MTPARITAERWGRILRAYIECLQDKAISPALQKAMYTASPCDKRWRGRCSRCPAGLGHRGEPPPSPSLAPVIATTGAQAHLA